jgi:glyoxylase-like metal-dependent hydrolase (beta-lactamase superfamily II)
MALMLTPTARRLLLGAMAATVLIAAMDAARAQYVSNVRALKLTDYLTAFYDGRPETPPPKTDKPRTWVEYGSMDLGIATFAIHHGNHALVYDTFPTVEQARWVRSYLEGMGINRFTVVNSHFHLDHVGGNEAYRDDIIIASKRTRDTLIERKEAIETGKMWGPPPVRPLVLPNAVFERRMDVVIGDVTVQLHNVNIHTPDSVVAYIPADRILLAGDTIEDTVVFISTPASVVEQIGNLATLRDWDIARIYPNHGNIAVISKGGYDKGLIEATRIYLRNMIRRAKDPEFLTMPIEAVIGDAVGKGWVTLWEPYRHVHEVNRKRLHELYKDQALPVVPD